MFKYNYTIIVIKIIIIINGRFYFSEGKSCPEKTRSHLTRCNMYFKCKELLERNTYVWIPEQCDEGLIYEHNLRVCVLPSDDWECQLQSQKPQQQQQQQQHENETSKHFMKFKENDIYHIVTQRMNDEVDDSELINYDNEQVNFNIMQPELLLEEQESTESNMNNFYIDIENEDEGDGDNDDIGSGMNKELNDFDNFMLQSAESIKENKQHEDFLKESKETSSSIDPKLTAQLQRLAQLIDGLKKTYQQKYDDQQELRPDQLNAFLAHFNIRNQYETYNPYNELTETLMEQENEEGTAEFPNPFNMIHKQHGEQQQQQHNKLEAELKIFTKPLDKHNFQANDNDDHHINNNFQDIVINSPDGIPTYLTRPYQNFSTDYQTIYFDNTEENVPKVPEETLKTVLELSKQMIDTQHIPLILETPIQRPKPISTATTIIQPIIYATDDTPFSNTNYKQIDNNKYIYKVENKKKFYPPSSLLTLPNDIVRPSSTLIHNHVHVNGLSQEQQQGQQHHHHYFNMANDKIDSYGQLINLYPPLSNNQEVNVEYNNFTSHNNNNNNSNNNNNNNYFQPLMYETTNSTNHLTQKINKILGNYLMTIKPNEFFNTPAAITKYFTPSQHLDNYNINQHFAVSSNNGNRPQLQQQQHQQQQQQQKPQVSLTNNYAGKPEIHSDLNHILNNNKAQGNVLNYENYPKVQTHFSNILDKDKKNYYPSINNPTSSNAYHNIDDNLATILNMDNKNSYFETSLPLSSIFHNNNNNQKYYNHNKNSYSQYYMKNKLSPLSIAPSYPSITTDTMKLINIGGNFINFDTFQQSILPFLNPNALIENKLEIITCSGGDSMRHPNITDCTRYYVCSKKNGKVLSYSCPSYMAFDHVKRMCDSATYKKCQNDFSNYQADNDNRLTPIQYLFNYKHKNLNTNKNLQQQQQDSSHNAIATPFDMTKNKMIQMYIQAAALATTTAKTTTTTTTTTTVKPSIRPNKIKKRKYYCKEGDKIPDQTSVHQYFVCYKNAQGQMKGLKMLCSKGLIFCPKTSMCTLQTKCLNN